LLKRQQAVHSNYLAPGSTPALLTF
jgi:hypothetical protein